MNRYDVDYFLETAPKEFQKLAATDQYVAGCIRLLKDGHLRSVNEMLIKVIVMMAERHENIVKLYTELANSSPRPIVLSAKEAVK